MEFNYIGRILANQDILPAYNKENDLSTQIQEGNILIQKTPILVNKDELDEL